MHPHKSGWFPRASVVNAEMPQPQGSPSEQTFLSKSDTIPAFAGLLAPAWKQTAFGTCSSSSPRFARLTRACLLSWLLSSRQPALNASHPPRLRVTPRTKEMDMNTQLGPVWILGMPFFRYYHTTFNRDRQVMRFAKAGEDCQPKSLRARDDGILDGSKAYMLGMLGCSDSGRLRMGAELS